MLSLNDEAHEALRQFATMLSSQGVEDSDEIEAKKMAAMAKIQRKLDAARHLYEAGELSREEYLLRKQTQEANLLRWQNYTTEVRQTHVELMMCAEAFNRLVGLWETENDEGRQLLARGLFDEIVFDLDEQRMTDFKLKPWAERFLVIRGMQAGGEGTALPPAGIRTLSVPVAVAVLLKQPFRDPYASERGMQQRTREIRELFRSGHSKTAIARMFAISPRRVGQVLVEMQSDRQPGNLT